MHDDELPAALERAVQLLREEPRVRDEWRAQLGGAIEKSEVERVWRVRPLVAAAACVAFAAIGAGATAVLLHPRAGATVAADTRPLVRFDLVAPGATRVSIVGDFNGWNPSALQMRRSSDGRLWELEVPLAPGRYTYGFVVDGVLVRDPSAPQAGSDDFGAPSSVVLVRSGGA